MPSSRPTDQAGDLNGQQLYRLSRLYSLPDFVKSASGDAVVGDEATAPHQYADPGRCEFPCHTKAATYVSAMFFFDGKSDMERARAEMVESRINDFADYHGIAGEVAHLREKAAENDARDDSHRLPDESFALVLGPGESGSGAVERLYPLRNAVEVKRAAAWLRDHADEVPLAYKQRMASRVLDKADEYGAGLGELDAVLCKQAGRGACAPEEAVAFLRRRASALKYHGKAEFAEKVAALADAVQASPDAVYDDARRTKLAAIVDDVDRATGLRAACPDLDGPEDVLFALTQKAAAEACRDHVAMTSGSIYRLADFDKLRLADVQAVMGHKFAKAVSTGDLFVAPEKLATIAPTLPRGDAELFDRLLSSVGVKPVAKEAAHRHDGLDADAWRALASI